MIFNFDGLSFQILNVIRSPHKDGIFDVAGRPYAAISFRIGGCAVFEIDGKHFTSTAGDVIFIPADMPYRAEYSTSDSIVVHLLSCTYSEAEQLFFSDAEVVRTRFLRILATWRDKHSANRVKSQLYDILAYLEEEHAALPFDSEFSECVKYIEENFDKPQLSVNILCSKFHVSRSALQRRFNRYFGISPNRYISKLRMNKALDMLAEGTHSVKRIAYECGFEDEKYFSRAFKKTFGHSPIRLTSGLGR